MLLTVSDKSDKIHKLDILSLSINQHQLKIPTARVSMVIVVACRCFVCCIARIFVESSTFGF